MQYTDQGGKSGVRGECPGPGPDCSLMMITTLLCCDGVVTRCHEVTVSRVTS